MNTTLKVRYTNVGSKCSQEPRSDSVLSLFSWHGKRKKSEYVTSSSRYVCAISCSRCFCVQWAKSHLIIPVGGNRRLGRFLNITIRTILLVLLFSPFLQSHAQSLPVADLSLDISLDPPEPIDPGAMGQFTLTYSNAGPDGVIPVARFQVVGQPVVFFGIGGCPLTVTDISGLPPNPTTFIYGLGPNRIRKVFLFTPIIASFSQGLNSPHPLFR